MDRTRWASPLLVLLLLSGSACQRQQAEGYLPRYQDAPVRAATEYVIGVHPLHNPERLYEIFGPVAVYLTREIPGAVFTVEASRNYAAFDEKLRAGKFHFGLPNPYQTLFAIRHGYSVFGKMADDGNFRGIILVRRDSGIERVADLKGKAVSFPAPTALAATMMPQYYLQTHGLKVMEDITILYVGSQESSIMNVFLGNVAAGATWPPPWRALVKERPELEQDLEIKWSTDPLPNNGLVARDDVPRAIRDQVAGLLFALHTHEEGRQMLARMELSRFEAATEETYAPVVDFLVEFNKTVRPVDF